MAIGQVEFKKITIENCKISFPKVFKPEQYKGKGDAKYSVVVLIPKGSKEAKKVQAEIERAKKEAFKDKVPEVWKNPLRDGDEKDYDGYQDHWYLTPTSKKRIGIVDRNVQTIIDEEEIYGGCICNVRVNVFAYEGTPSGVSFRLWGIQKVEDGERFAGGGANDFEVLDEADDFA